MTDRTPETLRGLEWNLSDDERRELHAHADVWEADRKRLEAIDALEHLCGSMEDYEWMEAIAATKGG